MRCADLTSTWAGLRGWLDESGVLILPGSERTTATAIRLDAIDLFKAAVIRLQVPVVYVGQTVWDGGQSPAMVTVRMVAGGSTYELTLVAAWYAALLGPMLDILAA